MCFCNGKKALTGISLYWQDHTMIYLDHNATTPVAEEVLEAMLPYFTKRFGNAASAAHAFGWEARRAVESATEQVAGLIRCTGQEIVYTSGATESVNLALKGVFEIYRRKGNHIITAATEHKAVLDTCETLRKQGARITLLETDRNGLIDPEQLRSEISDQTILVAVMYANNETGVIQPMREIASIVHEHRSILFSDATQAFGKIPIDLLTDRIDLMAFSAHKIYGPKGIGGLYVRRRDPRVILAPQIDGGGHQRGLRSGTLNVPGIVGLGAAAALAGERMADDARNIGRLRDDFESAMKHLPGVRINGEGARRLYNTSNLVLAGVPSTDVIRHIKTELALSAGSACTSENQEPSHVLAAMGLGRDDSLSSVRVSLGRHTTGGEIDRAVSLLSGVIAERNA